MNCVNCGMDLPNNARYCLDCGATQPVAVNAGQTSAADGEQEFPPENVLELPPLYTPTGYDWLEREARLDSSIDYSAQRKYEGTAGKAFGCLGYFFIGFIALLAIIPGVPLLAVLGIPAAILLAVLTYFNVGKLRERLGQLNFLQKFPGLSSTKSAIISLAIFGYLAVASVLSILLLAVTTRR
jgi:hypothetical protein